MRPAIRHTLVVSAMLAAVAVVHTRAADTTAADLAHTYQGGVLHKQITERGHVLVKKPGKMRWEYTAPEKKLFISDGVRIYSYVPEDKQVVVGAVPKDDQAGAPILFLAGKGNLARDFRPSVVAAGELPAG